MQVVCMEQAWSEVSFGQLLLRFQIFFLSKEISKNLSFFVSWFQNDKIKKNPYFLNEKCHKLDFKYVAIFLKMQQKDAEFVS